MTGEEDSILSFSLSWRPSDREFKDDSDIEALSVSMNDVPYEKSWASGCGTEEESISLVLGRLIGVDRFDLMLFRGVVLEVLRAILSGAEGRRLDVDEAMTCGEWLQRT